MDKGLSDRDNPRHEERSADKIEELYMDLSMTWSWGSPPKCIGLDLLHCMASLAEVRQSQKQELV